MCVWCVCIYIYIYIYRPLSSTLSIQVPFGRLEKATSKSAWCAQHAADLSSGHAWWNRLRYLVAVVQVLFYVNMLCVCVCVCVYMYILCVCVCVYICV